MKPNKNKTTSTHKINATYKTAVTRLVIATRRSPLALWQAHWVKSALLTHNPQLDIQLLELTTTGDKNIDQPLMDIGGKALFVKELQYALLDGRADLAVHCVKDLPGEPCPGLGIYAYCERANPSDVLITRGKRPLSALPPGSRIGTTSPRRHVQLQAIHPTLHIMPLRGNVGTRLAKLDAGELDGIMLAAAGLTRLNLQHRITEQFSPDTFIPAIGQGALCIECRQADQATQRLVSRLNHINTARCVLAERQLMHALNGDCHSAMAAYATLTNQTMRLIGLVGNPVTGVYVRDTVSGPADAPVLLGIQLAQRLLKQGAASLID